MIELPNLSTIVFIGVQGLGLYAAHHAITRSQSAQGAIAWSIALVTVPLVSLPFYAIFGAHRFMGYVRARRIREHSLHTQLDKILDKVVLQGDRKETVERLCKSYYTSNNNITLLVDGESTFAAILEAIDAAQSYILMQFYIFRNDSIGKIFLERLRRKRQAGVQIHLLFDQIGSHDLPQAVIKELNACGIETALFRSSRIRRGRLQINFRNHRKIVIVDGKKAFIGGMNVGDEYRGGNPALGYWRDTQVAIQGASIIPAQIAFVEDWYYTTQSVPRVQWVVPESGLGRQRVVLGAVGPADEFDSCRLLFIHALNLARSRIWIASPYLVLDESLIAAFQMAVLRGVEVRVLITDKTDNKLVAFAGLFYMSILLKAGVKVYQYQKGFMHQKVMLIDDHTATVGSPNLDQRSFSLNFEVLAWVQDQGFAQEVGSMLEQDFADSKLVDHNFWNRLSKVQRFVVMFVRLFSPIL